MLDEQQEVKCNLPHLVAVQVQDRPLPWKAFVWPGEDATDVCHRMRGVLGQSLQLEDLIVHLPAAPAKSLTRHRLKPPSGPLLALRQAVGYVALLVAVLVIPLAVLLSLTTT
eukprot:EG_transcript_46260